MGKEEKKMTEAEKHAFKFYDSETGELLGRTVGSWVKICIFYLAYFSFLTGLFIASLQIMQKPLNDLDKPLINTRLNIPGLNMFPKYDMLETEQKNRLKNNDGVEFYWRQKAASGDDGYNYYVNQTKTVLDQYASLASKADASNTVNFETSTLGPCASGNYGWDSDSPCIFIRLNRVIDWEPVGLFKPEGNFEASSLGKKMVKDAVYVRCTAGPVGLDEAIADEHKPTFKYFGGEDGNLDKKFFPYKGKKVQKYYQSPIVAVQITNINPGREKGYEITCEAYAQNIIGKDKDNGFNGVIKFRMKTV